MHEPENTGVRTAWQEHCMAVALHNKGGKKKKKDGWRKKTNTSPFKKKKEHQIGETFVLTTPVDASACEIMGQPQQQLKK